MNSDSPKIHIVGCPGSGKSTLGKHLAAQLNISRIELDAVAWKPGWDHMTIDEFQPAVDAKMESAQNGWVMDGNYFTKLAHMADRANTIVWLDLPKSVVMRRVVQRTLKRALTQEELWNGNREPLTNFYSWDPEENIIRWAWVYYDMYKERYAERMNAEWRGKNVIRLKSPADVRRFVASKNPLGVFANAH